MMHEQLCCLMRSTFLLLSNFVDPVPGTHIILAPSSLPVVLYPTRESLLVETSRFVTTDVNFLVYLKHVYVPLIHNLMYWCTAQIGRF
jgi:hypothetical protein